MNFIYQNLFVYFNTIKNLMLYTIAIQKFLLYNLNKFFFQLDIKKYM